MLSEATVGAMGTLLKVVIDNVQQASLFSSESQHLAEMTESCAASDSMLQLGRCRSTKETVPDR